MLVSEILVRKYIPGDEAAIAEMVQKDILTENIKDYSPDAIILLLENQNEKMIKRNAEKCHAYVLTDGDKIVGVGMIGPFWYSFTDKALETIFIDPDYKGQGLGRKIIETLEQDEYFLKADRVEIGASITALEFYKHMGYGFKKMGNIVDGEGMYRLEKYPKVSSNNVDPCQYNMRPYIDNEYHNYKEFVYQVKKKAYKGYVEQNWGLWDESVQRDLFDRFISNPYMDAFIVQLNGVDIGFFNGEVLEDGSYEIGNICIMPEYQGRGIGTAVLKDILERHKDQDIHIQYFRQNPVGELYKRLGFTFDEETEFHYKMIKKSENLARN